MEQPKIIVSAAADQDLEAMLKEVNDGFDSGRVKKAQLASWIITYFRQSAFSKQMENIRAEHFDQVAHLKNIIKRIEAANESNEKVELEKLLNPLLGKSSMRQSSKAVKVEAKKENS
jgi:hypothetical protein